jgi:hypothetical protein
MNVMQLFVRIKVSMKGFGLPLWLNQAAQTSTKVVIKFVCE